MDAFELWELIKQYVTSTDYQAAMAIGSVVTIFMGFIVNSVIKRIKKRNSVATSQGTNNIKRINFIFDAPQGTRATFIINDEQYNKEQERVYETK